MINYWETPIGTWVRHTRYGLLGWIVSHEDGLMGILEPDYGTFRWSYGEIELIEPPEDPNLLEKYLIWKLSQ